jgi:hypothetical protein
VVVSTLIAAGPKFLDTERTHLHNDTLLVELHYPTVLLRIRHAFRQSAHPCQQSQVVDRNLPFLPTALRASNSTAAHACSPPPVTLMSLNLNGDESTLSAAPRAPFFHCSWQLSACSVKKHECYVLPRVVKWPDAPVEPEISG